MRGSRHSGAGLFDHRGPPLPGRTGAWPDYEDEVFERLSPHPREGGAIRTTLPQRRSAGGNLAHRLGLQDDRTWSDLAKAYEKLDLIAVLPVYTGLIERELTDTDPRHYRTPRGGSRRCASSLRGARESAEVDELIAELRERYRRRPRLQLEFDRAGLP